MKSKQKKDGISKNHIPIVIIGLIVVVVTFGLVSSDKMTITGGAQIDDATDTINTDKSSYSPGDTVSITVTGTNIGDTDWEGMVLLPLYRPDGTAKLTKTIPNIYVAAGTTKSVTTTHTITTSDEVGIWKIQSKWNDLSYNTHARSEVSMVVSGSEPAIIDDATDTLTLDKSSYSPGDAIHMTATGTNIGDEMWYGTVNFKTTDPNGVVVSDATKISIAVPAGTSNPVPHVYSLPSTAIAGTWTIQTTWTDNNGVVHARTTVMI